MTNNSLKPCEELLAAMLEDLRPMVVDAERQPLMIGIQTGGVWVAKKTARGARTRVPVGRTQHQLLPRRLHTQWDASARIPIQPAVLCRRPTYNTGR